MGFTDWLIGAAIILAFFGGIPTVLVLLAIKLGWDKEDGPIQGRTAQDGSPQGAAAQKHEGEPLAPQGLTNPQASVAGFIGGIVTWLLWLSWTPRGFIFTTPSDYEVWQVALCVVTVLVVVAGISWFTRWVGTGARLAALTFLWGFSLGWVAEASTVDSSGMWGAGFMFLFFGGLIGLQTWATVVAAARRWKLSRMEPSA